MSHEAILMVSAVVAKQQIFNMPSTIDVEDVHQAVVIDLRQGKERRCRKADQSEKRYLEDTRHISANTR